MAYFPTNVLDNQIKALPTIASASGSVATFTTDKAENLVDCVAEISASATKCYLANMNDIANKSYFEGLLKGTHGFVDLGTLTWAKTTWGNGSIFITNIPNCKNITDSSVVPNMICKQLSVVNADAIYGHNIDNAITYYASGLRAICDNCVDAPTFKVAMSGVYLIYELETPTTPTITKAQFETLLTAFGLSGWLFDYDFGETVSSGATLDCISGLLTRNDDTTKNIGGNQLLQLNGNNNIFSSTGDIEVQFVLSVGEYVNQNT